MHGHLNVKNVPVLYTRECICQYFSLILYFRDRSEDMTKMCGGECMEQQKRSGRWGQILFNSSKEAAPNCFDHLRLSRKSTPEGCNYS